MNLLDLASVGPPASLRVTRATVYLDRVAANIHAIRALIGSRIQLMAVVKANAYGHGAVPIARAALAAGATWLGVACVDEGLLLRSAGITAPILVLGYSAPEELPLAAKGNLSLAIGTPTHLAAAVAAGAAGHIIHAQLKIDSGMGRFGFLPSQIDDLGRTLARQPGIYVEGCFTHMARGEDDPSLATSAQLTCFEAALGTLARYGIQPPLIHAANSGALLLAPRSHFAMVRAGILLYGYRPDRSPGLHAPFQPVMEITSRLARVETLPQGTRIGYGHTHQLTDGERVGLVPIGYADGLRRSLSGTGYLLAGGQCVPIIGRISMDQCMVDLTGVHCAEGDPVTVLGGQGDAAVWADDLGAWAGTIAYEILCGISNRLPRTYVGA
jgi:alanine racemase